MNKKGFSKISILFIVLLVLLIGTLGFFSYKLLFTKDAILVPDFSTSKQSDVFDWCNSLEINPCLFENDYSETVEKDGVIYQSIAANEELGENNISFIISLGKKVQIATPEIKEDTTKQSIENWISENKIKNQVEYIDEYNDTVDKTIVIRIEPNIIVNDTDVIKVYISKGIDTSSITEIEVEAGTYLNLSVSEFEQKVKSLTLVPNHNTDRDDYSSTIEKGKIVWHGSGTYEKNEKINYGLSLGKNENAIVVETGTYVGKTLTEFTDLVSKLGKEGLVPKHKEERDDYSDTIAKGNIVWHGSGTYEEKENISYGLSLGKKEGETITYPLEIKKGTYVGKTLDEFEKICKELGLVAKHSEVYSDDYSDTIAKGCLDWHGQGEYEKGETIHYTLSLGKKESGNTDIVIKSGDYVGKTYAEFETAVKVLGLKPEKSQVHSDEYSDTIAKGSILWHGAGTYVNGEVIHYSVSLGKKSSDVKTVNVVSYAGKTEDEFKKYLSNNNLKAGDRTTQNSDTYAAGIIISNVTGTKNEGSSINYVVSLGSVECTLNSYVDIENTVRSSSYDTTKSNLENYFKNAGFTNYTIKGEESTDYGVGILISISVNGNKHVSRSSYSANASIVATVSTGYSN